MWHKGNIPWNKGKKGVQVAWNKGKRGLYIPTEETKAKLRAKRVGKKPMLGKHHSEETKRSISETQKGISKNKGKNHPMFGKHHSKKTKKKISKRLIGITRSEKTRKKMSKSKKGKPLSEEHKKKISETCKKNTRRGKDHHLFGTHPSKKTREKLCKSHRVGISHEIFKYLKEGHEFAENSIQFKLLCKQRDKYKCKLCGSTKNLEIHHIVPKSVNPELCLLIANGITLCIYCHLDQHPELFVRALIEKRLEEIERV